MTAEASEGPATDEPESDGEIASMAKSSGGGGKATHSGTDYQNRCAAWFGTNILAERDVVPPLGLPADITLDSISCETGQAIDDALVETSVAGLLFLQAKHTISLDLKQA